MAMDLLPSPLSRRPRRGGQPLEAPRASSLFGPANPISPRATSLAPRNLFSSLRATIGAAARPGPLRAPLLYPAIVVMTFGAFERERWEPLPGAARLTMAQREAIESDEPMLSVVAGAGAGKTGVRAA